MNASVASGEVPSGTLTACRRRRAHDLCLIRCSCHTVTHFYQCLRERASCDMADRTIQTYEPGGSRIPEWHPILRPCVFPRLSRMRAHDWAKMPSRVGMNRLLRRSQRSRDGKKETLPSPRRGRDRLRQYVLYLRKRASCARCTSSPVRSSFHGCSACIAVLTGTWRRLVSRVATVS